MRNSIRLIALVAITVSTALAAVGATPASATTVCVAGTVTAPCTGSHPGGAFNLEAPSFTLDPGSGGTAIQCAGAQISGTAPATSATTLTWPIGLFFGLCSTGGIATGISVNPVCGTSTSSSPMTLNATWNQVAQPVGSFTLTLPPTCTIAFNIRLLSCTVTITGGQTIGNGGSGAGGLGWTNGSASAFSRLDVNGAATAYTSSGGGFGCPTAGAHTGALTATFQVQSASTPGVTLIS
jgi:hypothetical protein